jgi:hypothetical protein
MSHATIIEHQPTVKREMTEKITQGGKSITNVGGISGINNNDQIALDIVV